MTIKELRQAYAQGTLDKATFVSSASKIHQALCAYPEVLAECEVNEIRINQSGISYLIGSENLWLCCPPGESRVAPIEILNFGAYERQETDLMLSLVADDSIIFDIGANIGWYSLLLARKVPGAIVHAFEPLHYFHEFLCKNIALNSLEDRINAHPLGFSNEQQSVEIFVEKGNATNASMRNVADSEVAEVVHAEVVVLDQWIAQCGIEPDFIKCDVEGAELLVMQGARTLLADKRPIVFLEILRKWCAPYGYHPNDIVSLFAALGYGCFGIGARGVREIDKVDEETVETNYVFLHREQHHTQLKQLELV